MRFLRTERGKRGRTQVWDGQARGEVGFTSPVMATLVHAVALALRERMWAALYHLIICMLQRQVPW